MKIETKEVRVTFYNRWIIIVICAVSSLWASPERGWVSSTPAPSNTFNIVYNPTIYPIGEHKERPAEGVKVEFDGLCPTPKKDMIALVMNGDFYFTRETLKEFYFHLSSATVKILIDDKEIRSGNTDQTVITQSSFLYRFSQGKHRVKIIVYTDERQALVGVRIGMSDPQRPILSDDTVAHKIQALTQKSTMRLNYLHDWQSQTLNLKNADKENILFLSASRPATYTVNNVKNGKLKAIVYSGEGIEFNGDATTTILRVQNIPAANILLPDIAQCHSLLGGLLCPEDQSKVNLVQKWIQKIAHKPLDGFSSVVDATRPVLIPEIVVDKAMYQKIDEANEEIQTKRSWLQQAVINPYPQYPANQRWADILRITRKTTIPINRFRAYYMDKNNPTRICYSEIVDHPSLLYSEKPFHTILADNFLGLWVGDFTFNQATNLNLNVSLSWAKIRILDNGETLYEGDQSTRFNHTFAKGNHHIEVEYINNYGSVDVNVGFKKLPTNLYTIHNVKNAKLTAVIYNASNPIGKINQAFSVHEHP